MSKVKTSRRLSLRVRILERDGTGCWYCGRALDFTCSVTDPLFPTIEHVVPDGGNRLDNCTLAHAMCNVLAGDLAIIPKLRLRDALHEETEQEWIERKLKLRRKKAEDYINATTQSQ